MIKRFLIGLFAIFSCCSAFGQHSTTVNAVLNDSLKSLYIKQKIEYRNLSKDTLDVIYLNDWMNAFSDTRTPLARRFFEDYDRDFHFARQEKRGGTTVNSILGSSANLLAWKRPLNHPDLIAITPKEPLLPGEKFEINLNYSIKIPSEDFTRYGYSNKGKFQLRYWFMTPGVYDNGWQVYSHKNMNDLYNPKMNLKVELNIPRNLNAITPFEVERIEPVDRTKNIFLKGEERLETEIFLTEDIIFEDFEVDSLHILTNINDEGISPVLKQMLVKRIVKFLQENLGDYPHSNCLQLNRIMLITRYTA